MKVVDASPFWEPWEITVSSLEDFNNLIDDLFKKWVRKTGRQFAWRGVVDASWPLHSSLYRLLARDSASWPDEADLSAAEEKLLSGVRRWGLQHGEHGRLSVMEQIAMLQHFGAPTRFLDVTFNAHVALWFAVEEREEGKGRDGRVFAIDVTSRLINEKEELRFWEASANRRPWTMKGTISPKWTGTALAWRPPGFEKRIAAQHGAFLLGGVPSAVVAGVPNQWPKSTSPGAGKWKIAETRSFTSLPLRVHKLDPSAGGVPSSGQPVFTFRVTAKRKRSIRERLESVFGLSHRTLFPDYPGFSFFGAAQSLVP